MSSLALINEFLGQPPNASEHGYQIDHILEFSHWFMGALFFGWSAFFVFVLIRFRRSRHPKADHAGVRSGISTHLEFSVVLIEAVLLLGFAIPLWAKRVNEFPPTQDAILVHVVGQQFNWTFHMPGPDGQFGRREIGLVTNSNPLGIDPNDPAGKDDIVVLGELHVPVNRPLIIELSSKDVIHNFDLPHMRLRARRKQKIPPPNRNRNRPNPRQLRAANSRSAQTWRKDRHRRRAGSIASPGSPRSRACFSFAAAEWSQAKASASPCRTGRPLSATTCFCFRSQNGSAAFYSSTLIA